MADFNSRCTESSGSPDDAAGVRAAKLVAEIIGIADAAGGKDDIATAKLQIDARKWVVEAYLLRDPKTRSDRSKSSPIAVNIHTAGEAKGETEDDLAVP